MSPGIGCLEKMESPSLEMLKSFLDNVFHMVLLEWGVGPDALQLGGPFQLELFCDSFTRVF